jgi:hypothetical protein
MNLVIIGPSGSGKSSWISAASTDGNIGPEFINGARKVLEAVSTSEGITFYDSSNDPSDADVLNTKILVADAVVILYDASRAKESLGEVESKLLPRVKQLCSTTPALLVGNKIDLLTEPVAHDDELSRIMEQYTFVEGAFFTSLKNTAATVAAMVTPVQNVVRHALLHATIPMGMLYSRTQNKLTDAAVRAAHCVFFETDRNRDGRLELMQLQQICFPDSSDGMFQELLMSVSSSSTTATASLDEFEGMMAALLRRYLLAPVWALLSATGWACEDGKLVKVSIYNVPTGSAESCVLSPFCVQHLGYVFDTWLTTSRQQCLTAVDLARLTGIQAWSSFPKITEDISILHEEQEESDEPGALSLVIDVGQFGNSNSVTVSRADWERYWQLLAVVVPASIVQAKLRVLGLGVSHNGVFRQKASVDYSTKEEGGGSGGGVIVIDCSVGGNLGQTMFPGKHNAGVLVRSLIHQEDGDIDLEAQKGEGGGGGGGGTSTTLTVTTADACSSICLSPLWPYRIAILLCDSSTTPGVETCLSLPDRIPCVVALPPDFLSSSRSEEWVQHLEAAGLPAPLLLQGGAAEQLVSAALRAVALHPTRGVGRAAVRRLYFRGLWGRLAYYYSLIFAPFKALKLLG